MPTFKWVLVVVCVFGSIASAQSSSSMPPAQTTEVFGQKIRYYESGSGSVVILLHGMGSSADTWSATIAPLAKQFHVFALDQVGFGHSDKPLMDYKIATYADFLCEFMRVLGLPKATIVGSSNGGWIAATFAIQHPDLVDRLVLVDATGLPPAAQQSGDSPKPVDFSYSSLAATRAALERFFYDKKRITDELVRRVFQGHIQTGDQYTIQRLVSNRVSEYLADDLKSIHVPTLIVWGREDSVSQNAERFHAAIAGSQIVLINDCGHLPQVEKSSDLNSAVLAFLANKP